MSKDSIKERIKRLKKQVVDLKIEKSSYQFAYTHTQNLVTALKNTRNSLVSTASSLEDCFTKAGKIAKHEDIKDAEENIDNILNKLNTIILVNINERISNISRSIDRKNEQINKLWDDYHASED